MLIFFWKTDIKKADTPATSVTYTIIFDAARVGIIFGIANFFLYFFD